jgi:hypothetical protein
MTYATEIIHQYRLALRYLWNTHFWSNQAIRDIQAIREFEELKLSLFTWLVAKRLGPDFEAPTSVFGDPYKVVPKVNASPRRFPSMRVDIGFENRPGQRWAELTGEFTAKDMTLTILDFFDWNLMDWRDFRFYRVRIDSIQGQPDKVGREGLVDVLDVDVLWEPPGVVGLPIGVRQPLL